MGRLVYAGAPNDAYRLDDRLLAHLELAIGTKFRLGDSFAFTIDGDAVPSGTGYRVLWMHPSIALQFRYDGDRSLIALNPAWVSLLVASASSEAGLRILAEPDGPHLPAAGGTARAEGTSPRAPHAPGRPAADQPRLGPIFG